MMDMGSFQLQVHALLLQSEQYKQLVEARKAMYGERASEVSLASVIALLAQQEIARQEDRYRDTSDGNEEVPR